MTAGQLLRKAARYLARHPEVTACVAIAKASGSDSFLWAFVHKLFGAYFKPDDRPMLREWWALPPDEHGPRLLALYFMAHIADDLGDEA